MTWHERLDAIEARGFPTDEDKQLAENWVTCACGEQDPRIPRFAEDFEDLGYENAPKDALLRDLGLEFFIAIKLSIFNGTFKARRILAASEKRAAEVIADVERGEK